MKTNTLDRKYVVRTAITINAPKKEVWAVLADFDDVYTWAPGVVKSHGIAKKELGVGHGRHCVIQGFGGLDEIITEWNDGESLAYSVSPVGPLKDGESHWSVTDLGNNQTRLNIALAYNTRLGLFGKLMHSLMARAKLEASFPKTAQAIKNRVEQRSSKNVEPMLQAS